MTENLISHILFRSDIWIYAIKLTPKPLTTITTAMTMTRNVISKQKRN